MVGWIRRYEDRMGLGGLAPLRALLAAALLLAACEGVLVLWARAGDAAGAALYAVALLGPWPLLARFLPALCLLPLAARLGTPWVAVPYLAAGAAMPVLTHWSAYPYEAGTLPRPRDLGLDDWMAGVPTVAYGAILAILAARARRPQAASGLAPYRASALALASLVALGIPAALLWGGGTPSPDALGVVVPLLLGALKGAIPSGPLTGIAAHVLASGASRGWKAPAFLAAGLVAGTASPAASGHPAVWAAGFALFAAAMSLNGVPARVPPRRTALTPAASGAA